MISNFLNNPLLQQYLNRNFAQPVDTGMPVFNTFDLTKGGITNIPININQQPFNDYYGPNNIDTSFGVANEEDVEEDVEGARRTGGLADLFRTILGFAVPGAGLFMGAGRGALEGIQSLNQRLRATDFGQSRTLQEYFERKRQRRQAEKAQQAMPDVYESARRQGFTNDRGGFSTTSADKAGTSLGSGQFAPSTSRGRSGY